MANKIINGGLALLALAGALGFVGLIGKLNQERDKKEYQEFSAIYNDVKTIEGITSGRYGEGGQELLDGLGVNYKLKKDERVQLMISQKGVYVNVGSVGSPYTTALTRGFVERSTLEGYLSSHKTSSSKE